MHPALQHLCQYSLDEMSLGNSVVPLLGEFAATLQAEFPESVIGVTVVDQPGETFQYAVFPRMPLDFTSRLVNNRITGNRGSCGRAVLTGRVVESPDVENDERFSEEWKGLFRKYDLKSIVSTPALNKSGQAQGCIALIHPFNAPPTAEQRDFLRSAAELFAKVCAYSRTNETNSMLIGELEHRMRNLYSTIGGMAIMTMRSHPDPRAFRKALDDRLIMMQRSQSLGMSGKEIDLKKLLHEVLAAYAAEFALTFTGPDVVLSSEAAAALALVVHELGTNAAKYGALSLPGGEVDVCWSISEPSSEEDSHSFSLTWAERNGPPVSPPGRGGYGTSVIRGSLRNAIGGSAVMSYDVEGFNCLFTAPFTPQLGRVVETA